jgi:phosphoribosylformimino-5-aminoimidazole carboxamide ribotide isomerase
MIKKMTHTKDDFVVYPAIDLMAGKVVRLRQGDAHQQTVYSTDPKGIASRWIDAGVHWLHVVNLDGAFGEDDSANRLAVKSIFQAADASGVKIQLGGGLRSLDAVQAAFDLGASRAILGSIILDKAQLIDHLLEKFTSSHLAVGIDARQGWVQVHGWRTEASVRAIDLGIDLKSRGFETAIFTDIDRDGVGSGVNITASTRFADETQLAVIASGGVSDPSDVRAARQAGLNGIIVGRALYNGSISIKDCI